MTQTDHWSSRTIRFLEPVFQAGQKTVRIATGFFTVEGYDLIREHLADKRVYLMVGFDEMSKERLREKLIDDIMFHLSTWDGPNRITAVSMRLPNCPTALTANTTFAPIRCVAI